jgi:hypothetical protein
MQPASMSWRIELPSSAACSSSGRCAVRGELLCRRVPSLRPKTCRRQCAATAAQQRTTDVVGVVVVDHGSRRKESNAMLDEFCKLYQQVSRHTIVEAAHMEIAEPTIQQAVGVALATRASNTHTAGPFKHTRISVNMFES